MVLALPAARYGLGLICGRFGLRAYPGKHRLYESVLVPGLSSREPSKVMASSFMAYPDASGGTYCKQLPSTLCSPALLPILRRK